MNDILNISYAGNELWRYGALFFTFLITFACSKILKFILMRQADFWEKRRNSQVTAVFIRCFILPMQMAMFAGAMYISQLFLRFSSAQNNVAGLHLSIRTLWIDMSNVLFTIALALFFYKLVDVAEYYLVRWTSKTETKLDDMLVPVLRKTTRVTITILTILFIAQNVLGKDISTLLAGLGVGGLAVAIAARETLANFFGSIMIFSDRSFHVGDMVRLGDFFGTIEEVGFRSTRLRTLDGHLITIPNSSVANNAIENVSNRPFIRKHFSITITYDTPPEKVERAVEIIKQIISQFPETGSDPQYPPRVYFDNFNDWSLNINIYYWVKPADWWTFLDVTHKINIEIMRKFADEGIEFAFPTQTLYLKKNANGNDNEIDNGTDDNGTNDNGETDNG